jgi:phage tail protein X
MRVYARQGDTLDRLCWRALGHTAGVVEAALEANPGLATLGPVLPHGTPVDLPDPAATPEAPRALIQLWD